MSNDQRQPATSALGEALANLQQQLAAGETSLPSLDGLDPAQMQQVLRLQECLVQLERARPAAEMRRESIPAAASDDPKFDNTGTSRAEPPPHPADSCGSSAFSQMEHSDVREGTGSTAHEPRGSTFPLPPLNNAGADATLAFSDTGDQHGQHDGERWPKSDQPADATASASTIGRFEVLRVLGRGGQGMMLLAYDPVLARNVALKVPWSETLITPKLRSRFLREARAVARLTHPHIVAVYEVGEVGPVCFIASALVEGSSLAQWLSAQPAPADARQAAELVAGLADAMQYAHEQGVLHRDLKPGNVMLEPRATATAGVAQDEIPWTAKITDFGLAKFLDGEREETRTGALLGTPAYMSPEQAAGDHKSIGPASDVYSLGAILYELLTHRPPFRGQSDAETLRLVATVEPAPPQRTNPQVPLDLQAITLKCLEKDPQRRYASAGALVDDLRRFLAGEPTRARPLSAAQRAARWSARNRGMAALLATVATLLVCVAGVSLVAAVRIAAARDEAAALAERERETALRERAARQDAARALVAEKESLDKAVEAEHAAQMQRESAEAEASKAKEVSNFLVDIFMTADPMGTGKLGFLQGEEIGQNITLRELLDRGAREARRRLKDHPATRAKLLNTLGQVYCDLGLSAEAEPLIREAFELRNQHPENEADLADSLLSMGILLRCQGELPEAISLLRRALAIRERLGGPESLPAAEAEFSLCFALLWNSRFIGHAPTEDILEFDRRMVHVLQVQRRELGDKSRDVALTLLAMALRHFNSRDMTSAQKRLGEAALILAGQEGGQSLLLGVMQFTTAAIARRQAKFGDAERNYIAAIDNLEKALGKGHLFSAAVKMDFGGMLRQIGRAEEFERSAREILTLMENLQRSYPHGVPMLIEPLGIWAQFAADLGDFEEAIRCNNIIDETRKHHFGWSQADEFWKQCHLANMRTEQGRLAEAATHLQQATELIEEVRGEKERSSAGKSLLSARSHFELACGKFAEAERLSHELDDPAWQIVTLRALRPDDSRIIDLANKIEVPTVWNPEYAVHFFPPLVKWDALTSRGELAGAEENLRPLLNFIYHKTAPKAYFTGLAKKVEGQWLAAQGQPAEAEPLLLAGLENLRRSRGDHHILTRMARDALVDFYRRQGRSEDAARYAAILNGEPTSGSSGKDDQAAAQEPDGTKRNSP